MLWKVIAWRYVFLFFFSWVTLYGLQGIGHYAAWRKVLNLPPGLVNFSYHRAQGCGGVGGGGIGTYYIIRVCSIIWTQRATKRGNYCEPKTTVREPRWCYPEILQGPERTNVKGAHVTHFYPKILSPTIQIFSAIELFSESSLSVRRLQIK